MRNDTFKNIFEISVAVLNVLCAFFGGYFVAEVDIWISFIEIIFQEFNLAGTHFFVRILQFLDHPSLVIERFRIIQFNDPLLL
ncbi:MAG: hypothetical protein ACXVCY_17460 [Pseudobdellovibrionaceae bacterium]